MKLSTLEIKGFKSFADQTVIHFNNNITGIVGPNGCGKSNIVDAIRWVLGEQKTSMLRSEKMENLIFNGAKKRRASGLAEVTLTFENTTNILPTEFSNVTISRQYFRNGESQYRLNSVPCRLKDIISLFMDTGISSDSYAIIELSMVEDILTDKDNSRRKLFEQAAGVEKYKHRKRETINKLTSVDNDLNRVDDLLFEIENNLKTLESQARRARKYYRLREQYKELSIELAVFLLSDQKSAFNNINGQLEVEQQKKLALETKIQMLEANLQKEKAKTLDKEKYLSAIQKQLNEKISLLQQTESEKKLNAEKKKNISERNARLVIELQSGEQKILKLESEIQSLNISQEAEEKILAASAKLLDSVNSEMDVAKTKYKESSDQLKESEKELRDMENKVHQLEKQLAVNKSQLEHLENEKNQSHQSIKNQESEIELLAIELAKLEKHYKAREKATAALVEQENKLKEEILSNDRFIEKVKQELASENRHLDAKRNEYQLTKDLVDNLDGYPESIKFLKKEVKYTKNAPLLSDILSCPDEYKTAIENLLEPYLNYYVVDDWQDAIESINVLSNASKGRANFFILSEIEGYQPTSHLPSDTRIPALDLVEVEGKYRKLAAYLLDNVSFVDDITKDTGQIGETLLTSNGKFIRGKFSLSGGALGLFEGKKLGRAKNLDKLAKTIKALENKTNTIAKELNNLLQKSQEMKSSGLTVAINDARAEEIKVGREFASVKARFDQLQSALSGNKQKSTLSTDRIQSIITENKLFQNELDSALKLMDGQSTKTKKLAQINAEISAGLSLLSEKASKENIEYHKQDGKLKSIQQAMKFSQNILDETRTSNQNSGKEIIDLGKQEEDCDIKIKELSKLLDVHYKEKEAIEKQVIEAEEVYYESRGTINSQEEEIRTLVKNKEQNDHLISHYKEKMADLKLDLTSMKERLSVEFQVNLNDLLEREPIADYSLTDLDEKVEQIKLRLSNYGEINPMAVEAFEEMKNRFEFINAQKADLVNAKSNLLQTICEIDNTAKEKFIDTYEKVRIHFKNVFHRLFSEDDTCDLVLMDPENPLESKIEIIARPKGKKPLTINQLSGGEKSLTATALLFALYLIKPAPFCIFDEVDAPLDDVNIEKFVRIIREFSNESQFIIVTHNKSTMSSMDVIYGVTMVEEGVSKVVPVDFTNLN